MKEIALLTILLAACGEDTRNSHIVEYLPNPLRFKETTS